MTAPIIYWFRQDLRLDDLPGLRAAAKTGQPILPCFVLDEETPGNWQPGAATLWWLHHSLAALGAAIEKKGGQLYLARGDTAKALGEIAAKTGAEQVFCSRQYEPWAREQEQSLHTSLADHGVELKRFSGHLLFEPETIANKQGLPFKVFTPFWRHCRALESPIVPAGPCNVKNWVSDAKGGEQLEAWGLLPTQPNWAAGWETLWAPGEAAARKKLRAFLKNTVANYEEGRNFPATQSTSLLSPHLHFGEISPARIFVEAQQVAAQSTELDTAANKFLSEVGWREFSNHLLFHFPHLPESSFNKKFEGFPWAGSKAHLQAWQRGQTGYPLVDAGMRELWQTGYMHNRVRMVVASFLCKHLLVDWRAGQRWFWDTLLDADLANNACSWQWVSGSGADAAPYFRIFNPITQGKKFDKAGEYIRQWVPELAALPDKYLHEPWLAPDDVLEHTGLALGESYPEPIVDHRAARESALAAFSTIRSS
ncbi:MAG: deoxyribodipyrimidine photo-lyase [Halioglobus sp.]